MLNSSTIKLICRSHSAILPWIPSPSWLRLITQQLHFHLVSYKCMFHTRMSSFFKTTNNYEWLVYCSVFTFLATNKVFFFFFDSVPSHSTIYSSPFCYRLLAAWIFSTCLVSLVEKMEEWRRLVTRYSSRSCFMMLS